MRSCTRGLYFGHPWLHHTFDQSASSHTDFDFQNTVILPMYEPVNVCVHVCIHIHGGVYVYVGVYVCVYVGVDTKHTNHTCNYRRIHTTILARDFQQPSCFALPNRVELVLRAHSTFVGHKAKQLQYSLCTRTGSGSHPKLPETQHALRATRLSAGVRNASGWAGVLSGICELGK
jgi:hypothetical protein